ncbi:NADP-dependent oxidoreductase domain-containing protein [Aspergillus terricola var. indicus]
MTFGPDPSAGARITSLDAYNSILDYFQSQGYNEIDTARCYVDGKQEAFTRAARWRERGLICATKWYPYNANDDKLGAHRAHRLEQMFNKSLCELGTDCVDIFYLHAADRTTPFDEPLRKCNEMYMQGKFKQQRSMW